MTQDRQPEAPGSDAATTRSRTSQFERDAVRITRDALDIEPSQWPYLLRQRCGGDHELRDRVEALLATITTQPDLAAVLEPDPAEANRPPSRLGPFRLIHRIGGGGMGEVWLGERIEGGFRQQVAIKLVLANATQINERFVREQQILAQLTHANIAHLIDGGVTASGHPWLAMEYVAGEKITDWCDLRRLDATARVRLLLPVCDAVQYAHRALIVHRDIKPANLLVNSDGIPKLLDFGIAKLLDPADPQQTQTLAMTPAYAAPEQLRGDSVTTATDVYQLGLMLFELLSGIPANLARRQASGSTSVQTPQPDRTYRALAGQDFDRYQRIAEARSTSPDRLAALLQGDLGRIVGKAMAENPAARYGSVQELATDLRRWLQNLPVRARKGSLGYRAGKFLRRNPLPAALAGVAVLALTVGVASALWQSQRALHEAERANAVQEYLIEIFSASSSETNQTGLPSTRDLLDRGREGALTEFEDRPDIKAALLTALTRIHRQLGLLDEAHAMGHQAVAIRADLFGRLHPLYLESLVELGDVQRLREVMSEARPLFEEALELALHLPAPPLQIARIRQSLGTVLSLTQDHDQAEEQLRKALDLLERERGRGHPDTIDVMHSLALALTRAERNEPSDAVYEEAIALARVIHRSPHAQVANLLADHAALLRPMGRYEEAEQLLLEAIAIDRQIYTEPHPMHALHLRNLAAAQTSLLRLEQAERTNRQAQELTRELYGSDSIDLAKGRINLGAALITLNRDREAIDELELALVKFRESSEDYRRELSFVLSNLGRAYLRLGELTQAGIHIGHAIDVNTDLNGPDHPRTAHAIALYGQLELMRGDAAAGETLFRQALRITQTGLPGDHPRLAERHANLAESLRLQGRYAEAIAEFRESLGIQERAGLPANHQQVLENRLLLSQALLDSRDGAAARDEAALIASAIDHDAYPDGHALRARWIELQRTLGP